MLYVCCCSCCAAVVVIKLFSTVSFNIYMILCFCPIQLSLNSQLVNIYCTRRKQFWITTGDEQLTW